MAGTDKGGVSHSFALGEVTVPQRWSDVPETTDFISPRPFGGAMRAAIVNRLTNNQIRMRSGIRPCGN